MKTARSRGVETTYSNRLTRAELEAIIGVAGDAFAAETLASDDDPEAALEAFENGMEKLRRQLANMRGRQS